jgi:hypothetical protein
LSLSSHPCKMKQQRTEAKGKCPQYTAPQVEPCHYGLTLRIKSRNPPLAHWVCSLIPIILASKPL